MIWLSQTTQYRILPARPLLEYLLNYKTSLGFPSLDTTATDLTGPVREPTISSSSRLIFLIRRHENQLPYFWRSSISKSSILWRAWNGQYWLFHNLALFSIYGNDGTTILRRGVIINLKKYHWKKVQKGILL